MEDKETFENKKRERETSANEATEKKSSKRKRKKVVDPAAHQLRRTIDMCCRDNDLARACKAYDEAIEKGTRVEASCYYRLLALCDGLRKRNLHIGVPRKSPSGGASNKGNDNGESEKNARDDEKEEFSPCEVGISKEDQTVEEIPLEERKRQAFRFKAAMDEAKIPLTEAAYTPVIKLLAKTGELDRANELMLESEKVQQCKPALRLYSSLLQAYAEAGKPVDAVRVWKHLTEQKIMPSEKEYLVLLRCAVSCQNSTLMENVLTELAEFVPVPGLETNQVIIDWFQSPASSSKGKSEDKTGLLPILEKAREPVDTSTRVVLPSMGPIVSSSGWEVSRDCSIDTTSGTLTNGCLRGKTLQQVHIAPETWEDMQQANETIVLSGQLEEHQSAYQGGGKGSKRLPTNKAERERHWGHFRRYLDKRRNPVDVVIDGANVGFFQQNFDGAPSHVDYKQIDWVIEAFREQGKSVLVVMHSRHFQRGKLPRKYEPLVDNWIKNDLLYRTPPGMNDDWFWMHVALIRPGTLVLTNDEMRDHHFQMLAPRCFIRWKDLHQVHFDFGDWEPKDGKRPSRRQVKLTFPDAYTRKIQRVADGLVVPLPKRGDENRFLDGCFIAEKDVPESETYLCIRPKR